jgi:hypothetical protein
LPASFVPSRLSVPSATMPSAASSRSTWLNTRPAPAHAGPGTGRWSHDRDAARRRSPGSPSPARTAFRSPGSTARPGSTHTAAAPPSSPGRTPPARAHRRYRRRNPPRSKVATASSTTNTRSSSGRHSRMSTGISNG